MEKFVSSGTHRPLLVDLKGLSEYVSLSVSTLRKFIARGMPHIRPGRKILVDPNEAVDWLKQFSEPGCQEDDDFDAYLDDVLRQLD